MKHVPLVMLASVSLFAIAGSACTDGKDDGGAGAAGTAGTAAGSSGASGTAGTAGAAGTAGSGAAGGSGGAAGSGGSGGTGGASGSGAGGTTGDRCSACLDRQCTAAVDACEANAACTDIFDCVISQSCGEIPEPQVCIDDCTTENPSGQATFQPVGACLIDTCASDCSGS